MASTPLLLRWALVNLFLTAAAAGLTLFIWMAEKDVRSQLTKVRQREQVGCPQARVIKSEAPKIVDPESTAPPQDAPKSGYIGDRGTDISATMRLYLEALRGGPKVESLRFGAQEVLPSTAIHVVNLWATWCAPCKAEMPDFKALFARHPEWAGTVQFVPILVKDAADPVRAYQSSAATMPEAPVKLADRGMNDPFVSALAPGGEIKLFHGNLPVTLVLDCNRRVRWARYEQLVPADFVELEQLIEQFRRELADTGQGAWCRQPWPGNGRCEGRESTASHHSLEDCGELKPTRRANPEATTPASAPNGACPAGQVRGEDGRCGARLKEVGKAVKTTMLCGDGQCEPARGESKTTCCQDCPCSPPLTCKESAGDTFSCQAGLK